MLAHFHFYVVVWILIKGGTFLLWAWRLVPFFLHSKAAWYSYPCQNGGCCWCIYGTPMVMTDAIFRTRIWCALMFLPKVHGWYSPYAGKVLETSMVRDQSQIGLYVYWIAAHGGYGLAAEWSLAFIHACCLVSPYIWKMQPTRFESVAYMVLLKIPWISYGNWDVDPSKVAVVGSLCVDWMSSTHSVFQVTKKKAYTCILLLPVEMTVDSLAFSVENLSHCPSDQPVWEKSTHPPW